MTSKSDLRESMENKPVHEETTERQSLMSSFLVMLSTLSSRLLGFLRAVLISAFFGGGGDVDALYWAFSIPNNFRTADTYFLVLTGFSKYTPGPDMVISSKSAFPRSSRACPVTVKTGILRRVLSF